MSKNPNLHSYFQTACVRAAQVIWNKGISGCWVPSLQSIHPLSFCWSWACETLLHCCINQRKPRVLIKHEHNLCVHPLQLPRHSRPHSSTQNWFKHTHRATNIPLVSFFLAAAASLPKRCSSASHSTWPLKALLCCTATVLPPKTMHQWNFFKGSLARRLSSSHRFLTLKNGAHFNVSEVRIHPRAIKMMAEWTERLHSTSADRPSFSWSLRSARRGSVQTKSNTVSKGKVWGKMWAPERAEQESEQKIRRMHELWERRRDGGRLRGGGAEKKTDVERDHFFCFILKLLLFYKMHVLSL